MLAHDRLVAGRPRGAEQYWQQALELARASGPQGPRERRHARARRHFTSGSSSTRPSRCSTGPSSWRRRAAASSPARRRSGPGRISLPARRARRGRGRWASRRASSWPRQDRCWPVARSLLCLALVARSKGENAKAERLLRESIRILKPLEDRGSLCESQRLLAELLLDDGKVEEAERFALEAIDTVGPLDRILACDDDGDARRRSARRRGGTRRPSRCCARRRSPSGDGLPRDRADRARGARSVLPAARAEEEAAARAAHRSSWRRWRRSARPSRARAPTRIA